MVSSSFFDKEADDNIFKNEKKSIDETEESRSKGLQSLRRKILEIEDLRSRLDDEFLLRFLRVSKFDANKAFARLRKYYNVRKSYRNVFANFCPSASKTCIGTRHFLASPYRREDHSIVVIHKRALYDPSTMLYEDIFRIDCLVLELLLMNPITQVCGINIIIDMAGYSFQHLIQDTPGRVRMAVDAFQNSFPLRFKSIHIINAPHIFTVLYNIFYPFLTKKIKERLQLHSSKDWTKFHSTLPPHVLPEEYGGTIPNSDVIDLTDEVFKWESYFTEQLQYGFCSKKP